METLVTEPLAAVDTEVLNALTLIDRHAEERPDHPAILFEDERITYKQLVERSTTVAHALRALKIGAGSRICLIARNSPNYYVAYLGVLRAGGALFPINADLSHDEIAYIVTKTDPALALYDPDCHQTLSDTWNKNGFDTPHHLIDDLLAENAPKGSSLDIGRDPESIAVVIHTSGTTARPKGVIASDAMEVKSALALIREWNVQPSDISVCALPLSYTFGLFTASFVALSAGASVLLFKKFNPVHVLAGIEKHGATYMVGVPAMYAMMLEHVEQTSKQYQLKSVRFMASSGAPIAAHIKERFSQRMRLPLLEYYALSECTPIFSFSFDQSPLPPFGSCGRLIKGADVKIVDELGTLVPEGATGHLYISSERLMSGYYLDPERNASAFEDGWFNTGDLAYRDSKGFYYLVGRDRDQVISGGYKIASAEVEEQILKHESVAQAAVVGTPDDILGEVVKAVLVLKDGCQITESEIIAHCKKGLAEHKVPKLVEFREALPTSPAGKVLKRQLV